MSKAQGSPLSVRTWQTHNHKVPNASVKASRYITQNEKKQIMKQLENIVSQLSNLRHEKIGSLFEKEGHYKIKTCFSSEFLLHQKNKIRKIDRKSFHRKHDYYKFLLSIFRLHIQHLSMKHHVFFVPVSLAQEYRSYVNYFSAIDRWNNFVVIDSKIDSDNNRFHYFIASQILESMIPYFEQLKKQKNEFENEFVICHADLSTSNIFIDDDCNIICIIDQLSIRVICIN